MIKIAAKPFAAGAALLAGVLALPAQETYVGDIVGTYRFEFEPNRGNLFSPALLRAKEAQAQATGYTANANQLTINFSGTPFSGKDFSLDDNGTPSDPADDFAGYLFQVTDTAEETGNGEGLIFDVVSNTDSSLTVELPDEDDIPFPLGQNLTGCVRKHVNVGDLFPAEANVQQGDSVTIFDDGNLQELIFGGGNWNYFPEGGIANNEVIPPGGGMLVRIVGDVKRALTVGFNGINFVQQDSPILVSLAPNKSKLVGAMNPIVNTDDDVLSLGFENVLAGSSEFLLTFTSSGNFAEDAELLYVPSQDIWVDLNSGGSQITSLQTPASSAFLIRTADTDIEYWSIQPVLEAVFTP